MSLLSQVKPSPRALQGISSLAAAWALPETGAGVFEELEHFHFHVSTPRSEHHPKRGGGLTLSVASVDDHQTLPYRTLSDVPGFCFPSLFTHVRLHRVSAWVQ